MINFIPLHKIWLKHSPATSAVGAKTNGELRESSLSNVHPPGYGQSGRRCSLVDADHPAPAPLPEALAQSAREIYCGHRCLTTGPDGGHHGRHGASPACGDSRTGAVARDFLGAESGGVE